MLFFPRQTIVSINNPLYAYANYDKTVFFGYVDNSSILWVQSSADEGATWGTAVQVDTSVSDLQLDQPLVAVSATTVIAFYETQANSAGTAAVLHRKRSTDGGATWSAATTVDNGTGHTNTNGRFYRVASTIDGTGKIHFFYATHDTGDFSSDGLYYTSSTDNGATWSSITQPFSATANSPSRPFAASSGNNVYVSWGDHRFGGAYTPLPFTYGEAFMGVSSNNGSSWTEKRVSFTANRNASGKASALRICCCASGVYVNVCWEDLGDNTGVNFLVTTNSSDSANSFSTPAQVVPANVDHPTIAQNGQQVSLVWTDSNTGSPQQDKHLLSTDGGATFPGTPVTYTSNVTNDAAAPRTFFTRNFVAVTHSESNVACYLSVADINTFPATPRITNAAVLANQGPPPDANWTDGRFTSDGISGLKIVSNKIMGGPSNSSAFSDAYITATYNADQEAWVKLADVNQTSGADTIVAVRINPVGTTAAAYAIQDNGGGSLYLHTRSGGTFGTTLSTIPVSFTTGDKIILRAIGARIAVYRLPNGSSTWALIGSAINTAVTASGRIGAGIDWDTSQSWSEFGGGSINIVTPVTPSGTLSYTGNAAKRIRKLLIA